MRCIVIGAVLVGVVGVARADDAAKVKAVVAAQAKAMVSSEGAAFADTFASDALVLLGPKAVGEIAIKGTTTEGKTTWTIRFSELVIASGDQWLVQVAQFAIPRVDKDAKKWSADPDRTPPDAVPGASTDGWTDATSPKALLGLFQTYPGTAVLGSAPKELATGKAAKKLLGKWKKLSFASVGGVRELGGGTWKAVVGNVELAAAEVKIPYRVLAIMTITEGGWDVVCVHYAFTGY